MKNSFQYGQCQQTPNQEVVLMHSDKSYSFTQGIENVENVMGGKTVHTGEHEAVIHVQIL